MGVFAVSSRFASKDHDAVWSARARLATQSLSICRGRGRRGTVMRIFRNLFSEKREYPAGKPAHIVDAQQEVRQAERKAEQAQQEAGGLARGALALGLDTFSVECSAFGLNRPGFHHRWRLVLAAS